MEPENANDKKWDVVETISVLAFIAIETINALAFIAFVIWVAMK